MGFFDMFKKDYIKLANAASENGDQKTAAEYYEKAFTFNVKDPQLLFLAAIRYENLRDYKSMVRCVEQAAKEKHIATIKNNAINFFIFFTSKVL